VESADHPEEWANGSNESTIEAMQDRSGFEEQAKQYDEEASEVVEFSRGSMEHGGVRTEWASERNEWASYSKESTIVRLKCPLFLTVTSIECAVLDVVSEVDRCHAVAPSSRSMR
jgi:hypothetical protein